MNFTELNSIDGFPDELEFIDAHHMTELNSNLLIDAATETINKAYKWATDNRIKYINDYP